jgi:FixJ family two-component response regulator
VQPNEPEIKNFKIIADNSVIRNAVETLLSSAGYDTNQLNVALDLLKNAKEHSLVDKKEENVLWLDISLIKRCL